MLKKFDSGSIYDFCDCRNKKRTNKALKKQRVLGRNEGGNDGGECEGADCLENPIIASLWLWMREDFDWLKLCSQLIPISQRTERRRARCQVSLAPSSNKLELLLIEKPREATLLCCNCCSTDYV